MRTIALFSLIFCTITAFAAKCSTTEPATEQQQYEAFKDFVDLFMVQKNLDKAFDDYIPG